MTEPLVGKDSRFETLLDEYKKAIYELEDANELPDVDYSDMAAEKVDASRAALENLFAKQREEIAELKRALEIDGGAANYFLATVAQLRAELERQRETTPT